MKLKKLVAVLSAGLMAVSVLAGCGSSGSSTDKYPEKDIQGSIMWSAGGVCDLTSRAIGNAAMKELGQTIVFTNRAGSGGGVSTAYVNGQKADGYELLFGAENPQIAKVMGTSELDYSDFIPINLFCTTYGTVIVKPDSPYQTLEELVDAMLAAPGKINMATTGAGGLPQTVASMMTAISGTEPNMVVFDGENEAITAVMGGHADFTITTLGSAAGFYQSGDVKLLAMIHNETLEGFEDVPAITDIYPEYGKMLPWGPFYGVFVKNGTDQAIVDKLTEAFAKAGEDEEFLSLISSKGCFPLGISGDEAVSYLEKYRSVTSWLLYDAGAAEKSPEDFGIARVE